MKKTTRNPFVILLFPSQLLVNRFIKVGLLLLLLTGTGNLLAQGRWDSLTHLASDPNMGDMLLLSDGSVIVKTSGGVPPYGNVWDRLTPDSLGSYLNGTWSPVSPMYYDRWAFSSQVLIDGRVYVAGGEFGSGYGSAEVYDPVADTWTMVPPLTSGDSFLDANTEILPDGRVLQGIVNHTVGNENYIYDPVSNSFSMGPYCISGIHDESTWLKLPDNSILFVDMGSFTSERFIPALNTWIADATVPVALYDSFQYETGPAFLLPDGRGFFIGGSGNTAFYTPSGTTSPGSWAAGPKIPLGFACPDAPGAMMVNGKIIFVASPPPRPAVYMDTPAVLFVFDYLTDSFTMIPSPLGPDTMHTGSTAFNMLVLPDGNILLSGNGSQRYYVYKPSGSPLAAGKPIIDTILPINCETYMATGTGFNGITEGASFGDDFQMSTNYPLVRLKFEGFVFYARTHNWNHTGVMTGSLPDTVLFDLPPGLTTNTYMVELVVNGNPSAEYSLTTCPPSGIAQTKMYEPGITIYPNPANEKANVSFYSSTEGKYEIKVLDLLGQTVIAESGEASAGKNVISLKLKGLAKGVYTVYLKSDDGSFMEKMVVE
jgi:hypothetical protein